MALTKFEREGRGGKVGLDRQLKFRLGKFLDDPKVNAESLLMWPIPLS